MRSSKSLTLAATLAVFLSGCSAMNNGSMTPQSTAPQSPAGSVETDAAGGTNNTKAIEAIDAIGSPVKSYEEANANERNAKKPATGALVDEARATGTCRKGFEFFVPDKAGDPNSTEALSFYDQACTQLARDVVRKWMAGSTAGSETIDRTQTNYEQGNSSPTSVRTSTYNYTNASFTKLGYPIAANGFDLEATSQLNVGTTKSVDSDNEMVMAPSTTNVNNYCADSAGFNTIGNPKIDKTFGWNGGAFSGGQRTLNADGSTTWSATHKGQSESAAIGGITIHTGAYNTACPIVTPAYTLSGGTVRGSYTIPITVTFNHIEVVDLTVIGATLASGLSLNVSTNHSVPPTSLNFINGTVANGGSTVATFSVNTFGNGTLTVTATGIEYAITDWSVVR